jgi:hypothetical protein
MAASHDGDDVLSPDGKDSSILTEGVAGFLLQAKAREFVAFWLLDGNVIHEVVYTVERHTRCVQ